MTIGQVVTSVVVAAIVYVVLVVLARTWQIRLWRARDARIPPKVGQIWLQDHEPIYIINVNSTGITVRTKPPSSNESHAQWTDTHDDWQLRLKNRFLLLSKDRWNA